MECPLEGRLEDELHQGSVSCNMDTAFPVPSFFSPTKADTPLLTCSLAASLCPPGPSLSDLLPLKLFLAYFSNPLCSFTGSPPGLPPVSCSHILVLSNHLKFKHNICHDNTVSECDESRAKYLKGAFWDHWCYGEFSYQAL